MSKARPKHLSVCSARMLLECVQMGKSSGEAQLADDSDSLRSWLVFKLDMRTVEIPHALQPAYERLLNYYLEHKK